MTKPTHTNKPVIWTHRLPRGVRPGDTIYLISPDGPIYERTVDEHGELGDPIELTEDELDLSLLRWSDA